MKNKVNPICYTRYSLYLFEIFSYLLSSLVFDRIQKCDVWWDDHGAADGGWEKGAAGESGVCYDGRAQDHQVGYQESSE